MILLTLDEIEKLLKKKIPKLIFGDEPEKLFRRILKSCHPDHNPGDARAEAIFKQVNDIWASRNAPPIPPIVSPTAKYTTSEIVGVGDVADVHLAENEIGKEYLLKISRIVSGEALLKNEATILGKIFTAIDASAAKAPKLYFPALVESFPAKDKIQKHINVFEYEPGYYTSEQIHEKHPALAGRHIAWIFKRLLSALGATHVAGIVHGAVLPSHFLVCPGSPNQTEKRAHAGMLVGWGHAVAVGEKVNSLSAKYRAWYAPEILAKKPVTKETDIFMAGKLMVYLAGGDVLKNQMPLSIPKRIAKFISTLMVEGQKMRPADAYWLHDEFADILELVYGKPAFVDLPMG